jgi:hypothetical protein
MRLIMPSVVSLTPAHGRQTVVDLIALIGVSAALAENLYLKMIMSIMIRTGGHTWQWVAFWRSESGRPFHHDLVLVHVHWPAAIVGIDFPRRDCCVYCGVYHLGLVDG